MTEYDIEALLGDELIARALEWFTVHGHEHAAIVELVVDTYVASAEYEEAA
jgi:hypothetical protein